MKIREWDEKAALKESLNRAGLPSSFAVLRKYAATNPPILTMPRRREHRPKKGMRARIVTLYHIPSIIQQVRQIHLAQTEGKTLSQITHEGRAALIGGLDALASPQLSKKRFSNKEWGESWRGILLSLGTRLQESMDEAKDALRTGDQETAFSKIVESRLHADSLHYVIENLQFAPPSARKMQKVLDTIRNAVSKAGGAEEFVLGEVETEDERGREGLEKTRALFQEMGILKRKR